MKRFFQYVIGLVVLICMGAGICLINNSCSAEASEGYNADICFINTGKSDAILVKYDGKAYLIDIGTKNSVEIIEKAMKKNDVEKLDGVFLTHCDMEHIGGIKKLSRRINIPVVYSAEISLNDNERNNAVDKIVDEDLKLKHEKLKAKDKVYINDDVYFEVIGPVALDEEDDDNNSLVLKLNVNGRTVLFTGDAKQEEQQSLIDGGADIKADVLKVPHHGKKDAANIAFAKKASPKDAVITTDRSEDNTTAAKEVLKMYKKAHKYITDNYNIGVLVTIDKQGKIKVIGQ